MESNEILSLLAEHYKLKGSLIPLAGELDLNYKLTIDNETAFIVKISRDPETISSIAFQEALLRHLKEKEIEGEVPQLIPNLSGTYQKEVFLNGKKAILRVLQWVEGRLWSQTNPILSDLRYGLGNHLGNIAQNLQDFKHPFAQRSFEWNLSECLWVEQHLGLFTATELELVTPFITAFKTNQETYNQLPKSIIHNDANDHNIVVSQALIQPKIIGIIDYGDACYSQTINDLAVACTYGIMDTEDPLAASLPIVKGYHQANELSEKAISHLYT